MALKLPNDKIVYNLPEQVGVNTENIKYLAEVYKDIDSIPAQYAELKADYDDNIKAYFDDTMKPTFTTWTNTFNGWTNTLDTYLANMSSAAVGAISGQTIAPGNVNAVGSITADSIIENMSGYTFGNIYSGTAFEINIVYAGAVKNGNKLTLAIAFTVKRISDTIDDYFPIFGKFYLPSAVLNKIYPSIGNLIDVKPIILTVDAVGTNILNKTVQVNKGVSTVSFALITPQTLTLNQLYFSRIECTFLLSDSLAS